MMRQVTSSASLRAELEKWVNERIAEKTAAIVGGALEHIAYKERCAELRTYLAVLAELPQAEKRAISK